METSETIEQQEPQAAESREDTAPETVAPELPASETAAALESMAAEELLPGVEAPPDAQAILDPPQR